MPKYRNSLNISRDQSDPKISRRSFLALMGVGAFLGSAQMTGSALLGFLYPNAMKVPPSVFSIGRPDSVLAKDGKIFNAKQRVFIEVSAGKVRVQTAVCTHLGCTVNAVETGYSCPCHGSTYDLEGGNISGPAPKPLVYHEVFRGASGELLVNKAKSINSASNAWYSPIV